MSIRPYKAIPIELDNVPALYAIPINRTDDLTVEFSSYAIYF